MCVSVCVCDRADKRGKRGKSEMVDDEEKREETGR